MKTIFSSLLALSLLTGSASLAFASAKKGANGGNRSSSSHKRSSSRSGRHRSTVNRSGSHKSSNVPQNSN
jgi:hypothetical protein